MNRKLTLKLGILALLGAAAISGPVASAVAHDPAGMKKAAVRGQETKSLRAFLRAMGIEPFAPLDDFGPAFVLPPDLPPLDLRGPIWSMESSSSSSASTSVSRTNDDFVVRHRLNDLKMTVKGLVVDGKGRLAEVVFKEGREAERKATTLLEVPEHLRAKVERLLEKGAR